MTLLRLRQRAREDLIAIGVAGRDVWGDDAALRYVKRLYGGLGTVAEHPEIGLACDEVRKGARRLREGSYVIYHVAPDHGPVEVLRVLHVRMLPAAHVHE